MHVTEGRLTALFIMNFENSLIYLAGTRIPSVPIDVFLYFIRIFNNTIKIFTFKLAFSLNFTVLSNIFDY